MGHVNLIWSNQLHKTKDLCDVTIFAEKPHLFSLHPFFIAPSSSFILFLSFYSLEFTRSYAFLFALCAALGPTQHRPSDYRVTSINDKDVLTATAICSWEDRMRWKWELSESVVHNERIAHLAALVDCPTIRR